MDDVNSKFLEQKGYHSTLIWHSFLITHAPPKSVFLRRTNRIIRDGFGKYGGVYIFVDESNTVLYVGIGNLAERVRCYYNESLGKKPGNNAEKHIKFFSQHLGVMKILWAAVEDRHTQRKLKIDLTEVLQPKYKLMKEKGLF
jgi:hypothetical protein